MADESNESSKPSWKRKKAVAPTPASRRAEASRHAWTKKSDRPADEIKLPRSRALWVATIGSAFAACVVGLVILILMIRKPTPAAVVFVRADYATNLAVPHNVAGWKGIEGIRAISEIQQGFTLFNSPRLNPVFEAPRILERKERWAELVEELDAKDISGETIVFVLALHGMTRPDGAYLLPNLATRPEDGLLVADVIKSLAGKFRGKNKVLILEGARVPSDWRLGMLQNDFAHRLKELEPQIEEAGQLWVLSAADVDQRCWTSEGLGTSVFFHYLAEALKGKAAGRDDRIDLGELHEYVSKNVRDWVWEARGAIQEPILLPQPPGEPRPSASRAGASKIYLASAIAGASPSRPSDKAPNRDRLKDAWRSFHGLNAQTPHPAVYSPARWRLYRSTLVRCEELIEAGDPDKAEDLFKRLREWEGEFTKERPLPVPSSIENSLVMNAVQGGRVNDPNAAELTSFWQASRPEQLKRIWENLDKSGNSAARGDELPGLSPRARAGLFLMKQAVSQKDIVPNIEKAAERLSLTKRGDLPQPAEVHYLRMLREYLPLAGRPTEAQALVTRALMVRRDAERCALGVVGDGSAGEFFYCEQIHPWIAPLVEKADVERRRGEDRLFASEEHVSKDVRENFDRATEGYKEVASRSTAVRSALAARDRVFAELPDYSRWLAHRHAKDVSTDLVKLVGTLWSQAHDLSERLDKPPASANFAEMAQLAKDGVAAGLSQVAKGFADKQREYNRGFADKQLQDNKVRQPEDWDAATAAAAVPFPDSGDLATRKTIWERLDHIRQKDVDLLTKLLPVEVSDADRDLERDDLRSRAREEGQTAVAVLGQAWYDDVRFKAESRGLLAKDIEDLKNANFEKEGRRTLAEVGRQVGIRFRKIDLRVAELLDKKGAFDDLKGARDLLPEADRLSRRLDVRSPLLSSEDPTTNLSGRLRRLRGHNLLIWLAHRAWLDHWYDVKPDARPYFQAAASRFIDDALDLFPGSPEAARERKLLDSRVGLAFNKPESILLTSELQKNITYQLVIPAEVPEGIPVIKPEVGPSLKLTGENPADYRLASSRTEAGGAGQSIDYRFSSPLVREAENDPKFVAPRVEPTTFGVRGFFRGQVFEQATTVVIDPLPEVAMDGPGLPNPGLASLAVRADQEIVNRFGEGNGSIAIVLDCSGSMVDNGSTKFADAKRSLLSVLADLPRKTRLSIWIFGQAADGFIDKEHARQIDVDQSHAPETTIRLLRAPSPWEPAELNDLRKSLDALKPVYGTPLVEAMRRAKLDLDQAKGLKTMLVLTDGWDDQFRKEDKEKFMENGRLKAEDFENFLTAEIPAFIRETFKDAGIMINMIFFKLDKEGEKLARKRFEGAITQLEPVGHFFTAQDANQLLDTLRRSIKQELTCRVVRSSDGKTAAELDVTDPNTKQPDNWSIEGLDPGAYTLKVQADKVYEKGVDLEKGDRLIVRLVSEDDGIGFERAPYGEDFSPRKESSDAGGWRFAAAQTRYEEKDPMGPLQLLTILEPESGKMPRLRQSTPRFTWFEMVPQSGRGEFAVRWRQLGAYPGTVWRGEVPRWVGDAGGKGPASPDLRAWWLAGPGSDEDVGLSLGFNRFEEVKDRPVRAADGATATVESIAVEEHPIWTRADRDTPERVDCLVIRLRYDPRGMPFFVDPDRLLQRKPSGHEHRFYRRAGAYTGLFGPITRTEVEGLRSISLVPVAKLKSLAEGQKQFARLPLEPPPANGDRLREPPRAINP